MHQDEEIWPKWKADQNSRKRAKQRGDRQPVRCGVQNTDNQDAHRIDWARPQNKEEMKATQNQIKQNILGTNSEGKETSTQLNDVEQKEEINIWLEQNEETKIQKKWGET